MHRHDVRVMQVGRRLRFLLEARQLLGIEGGGEGEHLEGDAPAQRNLLRFVDNAHAAPADLADDAKIAEAPPLGEECSGGILSRCRIAQPRGRVVQQGQLVQVSTQGIAQFRVFRHQVVGMGRTTLLQFSQVAFQDTDHPRRLVARQPGGRAIGLDKLRRHDNSPPALNCRRWSRARSHSTRTAPGVRSIRLATSSKASPSRFRSTITSR